MIQAVRAVDNLTAMRHRLEAELEEAETKAHKALADYKFERFGYWAAVWVHLNRIGGFKRPNPFRDYVMLAKNGRGRNDG